MQEKFERLHRDRLEFQTRLGQKRPLVEFLFEGSPSSSDERFKRYVQWVRTGLMEAVLDDEQALASVLYFLIETPESRETGDTRFVTQDRHLKKSREDLHLEIGMRLGDAVAGAVDTLLLRYVMVRFLESYHPEAMQGLLQICRESCRAARVAVKKRRRQAARMERVSICLLGWPRRCSVLQ